MTVPEAQERLEALAVTLASCANSPKRRGAIEVEMARCYRIIQRAQQRAHQSLASVATVLLEIKVDTVLKEKEAAAIIAAAHLLRCASTEQLAVAVPAAIHEASTDSTPSIPNKFPEFFSIVSSLLNLDGTCLSFEEKFAVRAALQLMNIAERPQIHHSMRRAQACLDMRGARGMVNRLREIYVAYRPQKRHIVEVGTRSERALPLDTRAAAESFR
jgi:uncharacterized protein YqgV (UPF0045/DUF77 family)